MADPIRVVVADDHPMQREAIAIACEGDGQIRIVAQASDGEEALRITRELQPDVLVLDLMLPKMDGFEVARRLARETSKTRILVLSSRDDSEALFTALGAGAAGYLDKAAAVEMLAEAIRGVAAGESRFTPDQQRVVFGRFGDFVRHARDRAGATTRFTDREKEILAYIADGMTTHQMARRLGLSPRTIDSHITNTYAKLDVNSRTQAARRARELGLIPSTGN